MDGEADGALYLTMRMAQLLGMVETKQAADGEIALFRLGIALAKLYTAKQAVAVVSEAIECFGGQGYMEDTGLPRLLRDAQVLPIWEGTTNVLALDALRVLRKPESLQVIEAELDRLNAPDRQCLIDVAHKAAKDDAESSERGARRLAYTLASSWMSGLLGENAIKRRDNGLRLP